MKLSFCSFIFFFYTLLSFGQVIKTYTGKYENGTAIYQYYENENYERVLQGNFSYNEKEFQITGQFNKNFRNGLWKATTSVKKNWDKNAPIITELVTATYSNGKLEGLCTYKKINTSEKIILVTATANFKNNIVVGSYKFDSNNDKYESNNKFSIDCFFTKEGFLEGTLKVDYNYHGTEYQDIQKYRTGFLYWALCRNLSNGNISKKYDRKKFIDELYLNYDSVTKISIIPYSEFLAGGIDPVYLSSIDVNPSPRPNELGVRKNVALGYYDDTVIYKNAPFTFVREQIKFSDYQTTSSFWNLQNVFFFWNIVEDGNIGNPLYRLHNGIIPVSFLPVKQLALDDKKYKEILFKK